MDWKECIDKLIAKKVVQGGDEKTNEAVFYLQSILKEHLRQVGKNLNTIENYTIV